jgi:dolichol-phosphate mannosyltransferase
MHPYPDLLSVVVPIYNEEATLPLLRAALHAALAELPCLAEIVFVDDGSSDDSRRLLREAAAEDQRIQLIGLSRNFGQQMAATAGLDFAQGDVVVLMDGDLQDPPELIPALVEKYQEGFDIVYAQRTRRAGETWLKKTTAALFYRVMRRAVLPGLPPNTSDFRLMSRPAVDAFRQMRERSRFVRGMVTWLGFRQTGVPFERPARSGGQSKYSPGKLLALAWRAITSFSGLPLRLSSLAGAALLLAAGVGAGWAAYRGLGQGVDVPLGVLLATLQVGLAGLTLLALGVIGDYLACTYDEVRQRPLYVVGETLNLAAPRSSAGLPLPSARSAGRALSAARSAPRHYLAEPPR